MLLAERIDQTGDLREDLIGRYSICGFAFCHW
jgi:hypothetical protein